MIVRTWRARAEVSNRTAYPAHFRNNVLPELKGLAGFAGASLLEQEHRDEVEFLVLTRWTSFEAIRGFATGDISGAVVEPEAVAALVAFDRVVDHYEVLEDVTTA